MSSLLQEIQRSGFSRSSSLIHLFVGGSQLHGAKIGTTDDTDLYGVFLESPQEALGLDAPEHFVWSSAGDDRRNGPDDVDVTLYSLRKWTHMACKGNPTALHFLFTPPVEIDPVAWETLCSNKDAFLSKESAKQFLGFADDQLKRITGEKGRGAKGRRPEYESVHGYDTKAAMHCIRLLYECIELMKAANLTFPRPERDLLIEVRSGSWTLDRVLRAAQDLFAEAESSVRASPLPERVDRTRISALIADTYLRMWTV